MPEGGTPGTAHAQQPSGGGPTLLIPPANEAVGSDFPDLAKAAALVVGQSGAPMLHSGEYTYVGAMPAYPRDRGLDQAAQREYYWSFLARWFELRKPLGPPPWAHDRFQVFGALRRAPSGALGKVAFAVAGRDFELPASPEQSLGWHERAGGSSGSPESQKLALDALRSYEVDRRGSIAKIIERALALVSERRFEEPEALGYVIIGRQLIVLRQLEFPEVADLLKRAGHLQQEVEDEASKILGGD